MELNLHPGKWSSCLIRYTGLLLSILGSHLMSSIMSSILLLNNKLSAVWTFLLSSVHSSVRVTDSHQRLSPQSDRNHHGAGIVPVLRIIIRRCWPHNRFLVSIWKILEDSLPPNHITKQEFYRQFSEKKVKPKTLKNSHSYLINMLISVYLLDGLYLQETLVISKRFS